jgi:hypothetical protein
LVGDVLARELVDAAIAAAEEEQRIDRTATEPFRVVALEAFAAADGYDWEAITREHGAVAGVMRVSRPAVAGTHGIVRYEFAARDREKSWAAYRLFTRDHHGRWTSPRGTMGSVEH